MSSAVFKDRRVFSTGDVARICRVAPRTVSQWFDKGLLRGYRIPGSRDRRIPRDSLIAFMQVNGLPMDVLLGHRRVLLVGCRQEVADQIRDLLDGDYRVEAVVGGFEAGWMAAELSPDTAVIDLAFGQSEGIRIGRAMEAMQATRADLLLFALGYDDTDPKAVGEVFAELFSVPVDVALLAERIVRGRDPAHAKVNGLASTKRKARQPARP